MNENALEEFREHFISLPDSQKEQVINYIKAHYIKELVKKYLLTAQEVRDNKDKSPETRRKNLKKLLEPVIWLNKFIHGKDNPYRINFHAWEGRNYDRDFYPFINEDIIDLDTEIDVSKLKNNPQKYHIYYNGNIINMRHDKISFPTRSECLLAEYYNEWILKITPETMQGNADFLDNILFVYATKRALNGDEIAVDKLCHLYSERAIATAIKMAKKRYILKQFTSTSSDEKKNYSALKDEAVEYLKLIISGVQPEKIIESLQKPERDKSSLIPLQAEKYYLWYYSKYLPPLLQEGVELCEKEPENWQLQDFMLAIVNPYFFMKSETEWSGTPKRKFKFNSFVFRPNKKTNLTTWLFGTKSNPMQGRFCQYLNEKVLDREAPKKREIHHDFTDEPDYKDISPYTSVKKKKDNIIECPYCKTMITLDKNTLCPFCYKKISL